MFLRNLPDYNLLMLDLDLIFKSLLEKFDVNQILLTTGRQLGYCLSQTSKQTHQTKLSHLMTKPTK